MSCVTCAHKLTYVDTDLDTNECREFDANQEFYWWEEVDRTYPFSESETEVMSDTTVDFENQGSDAPEANPTKDAEHLEVYGDHGDVEGDNTDFADNEFTDKESGFEAAQKGKKRKKKNTPEKNANKKTRNADKSRTEESGGSRFRQTQARQARQNQRETASRGQRQEQHAEQTQQGRGNRKQQRNQDRQTEQPRPGTPASQHLMNSRAQNTPVRGSPLAQSQILLRPGTPLGLMRPPTLFARPQAPMPLVPVTQTGDEEATDQGRDREAHRRMLEANNPVSVPSPKKKIKERTPPDMTFEITYPDLSPVGDDYIEAAEMLKKAKKEDAKTRDPDLSLKIDSRKLRSGDWIVLAKDLMTKEWLLNFFNSESFCEKFKATLCSERGDDHKYVVRVQPPDSTESTDELLTWLFRKYKDLGYVRIISETRVYRDRDGGNETNKAYHKALKKGQDFDDKGVPYIKSIWLRMNAQANEHITKEEHLLSLWPSFGICELEIDKVKDKKGKKNNRNNGTNTETNTEQEGTGHNAPAEPTAAAGQERDEDENMTDGSDEEHASVVVQESSEEDVEGEKAESESATKKKKGE